MEFIIRDMEKEDLTEINKIRNYYINNTLVTVSTEEKSLKKEYEWFENLESNNYPMIVVKKENNIIGYSYLTKFRDSNGYKNTVELSIILLPEYKGLGIGNLLLKEIEKKAKENKYYLIVSVITSSNKESIKFHDKNGFKLSGEIKNCAYKNGDYLDIIFMSKKI